MTAGELSNWLQLKIMTGKIKTDSKVYIEDDANLLLPKNVNADIRIKDDKPAVYIFRG